MVEKYLFHFVYFSFNNSKKFDLFNNVSILMKPSPNPLHLSFDYFSFYMYLRRMIADCYCSFYRSLYGYTRSLQHIQISHLEKLGRELFQYRLHQLPCLSLFQQREKVCVHIYFISMFSIHFDILKLILTYIYAHCLVNLLYLQPPWPHIIA